MTINLVTQNHKNKYHLTSTSEFVTTFMEQCSRILIILVSVIPMKLEKAGLLGKGKTIVSLVSIDTTSNMFGLSAAIS